MSCGLFSVFDPCVQVTIGEESLRRFLLSLFLSFLVSWQIHTYNGSISLFLTLVNNETSFPSSVTAIFWIIFFLCLLGGVPFSFPIPSHPGMVFPLALTLWLGGQIVSMNQSFESWVSHFLPVGAPMSLSPFLILIEFLSSLVQPLSLSVRLIANVSIGHVILSLVEEIPTILSSTLGVGIVLYELFVCLIQAYVFSILVMSYWNN